jgi:SAM-dependent methyltransferase
MLRLFPQPERETLARYYPGNYWFDPDENRASKLADAYRRIVLLDHLRFVQRAYRSAGGIGPLLDVGCGGGLLPGMLRERGLPAMGLDSSPAACSIAWRRHRVPALAADLAHVPFASGSFTLVSLFHVLEHLPEPRAYVSASRELLAPQGRLVVQIPDASSWQFRLLGNRWNGLDIPRHLNNFRGEDLRTVLEDSGFAIERVKHFSLRDNPAGLATSLAPHLDPMARRIRGLRSGVVHHAAYLALVLAALPFAGIEAAFGHGSSIMVEARKQ